MGRTNRWPAGAIALTLAVLAGQAGAVRADIIHDAAGDFNLPFYTGVQTGALDVIRAGGQIEGNFLHLFATMAAPINSAPTGSIPAFVWGIQTGPRPFPGPFANVGHPNVLFNNVFVQNAAGAVTNNAAAFGSVNGANVDLYVPLSAVPSTGYQPQAYLWNLWPRDLGAVAPNPNPIGNNYQISDFAPSNAVAAFTSPEPVSVAVFGGLVAIGGLVARRRTAKNMA
jgi:hypothetical protein